MQTRAKSGIVKPKAYLSTDSQHQDPCTMAEALSKPLWKQAMDAEYEAILKNNTWDMVPPPSGHTIIQCKWVFRSKFKADGTLDKYKDRLVAKGFKIRALQYLTNTRPDLHDSCTLDCLQESP